MRATWGVVSTTWMMLLPLMDDAEGAEVEVEDEVEDWSGRTEEEAVEKAEISVETAEEEVDEDCCWTVVADDDLWYWSLPDIIGNLFGER